VWLKRARLMPLLGKWRRVAVLACRAAAKATEKPSVNRLAAVNSPCIDRRIAHSGVCPVLVAIGYIVILASVFGGYMLAGGHLAHLFQPTELLIIFGAGIGAFVVGNDKKAIGATVKAIPGLFKGSRYTKALYMEVMALLYVVLSKIRREGMMSIEADIENPHESALFSNYPTIQADHHALDFICDYLRLMVGGNLNPFQIEALMDQEIDTHHHEAEQPARIITKVGDAMPAFGIVAAVMGVVHTMGSVGLPPAELGKLIASAPASRYSSARRMLSASRSGCRESACSSATTAPFAFPVTRRSSPSR